ncbi:MAG: polysaccharide deacetylase family protein [Clostridia bacterium]|nr:polysaccharide deacetylase family protein [Clostridia bacterium]
MEKRIGKKLFNKQTKTGKKVLIITAMLVILAVVVFAFLMLINRFTLVLTVSGDKDFVLEFGEEYIEPGVSAVFKGTVFKRKPVECQVNSISNLDVTKAGNYQIEYSAKYVMNYLIFKKEFTATEKRTIQVVDSTPPVIKLQNDGKHFTLPGTPYEEEGIVVIDNCDGDITANVVSEEKDGKVYYSISDSSGNKAEAVREIVYGDPVGPELKLLGDGPFVIAVGGSYQDPGYIAIDNVDGDVTDKVAVQGRVNTAVAGEYTITYSATDTFGNTTTQTRNVTVRERVAVPDVVAGSESTVLYSEPANPNGKMIYLTFDDGPGAHTGRLLDVLKKYNVKATFFVVNTGSLDILTRMQQEGHTVAMHSATHSYEKIYANEDAYFEDLSAIENAIKDKLGDFRKILRFPGGGSNAVSKRFNEGIMTRLTQKVKELGYRYYDWNVDSNDAGGTKTADGVFNNVTSRIPSNQYSIVLQHDIHSYSVDAVERIIIWGLKNGYSFRALSESSPICEHHLNN